MNLSTQTHLTIFCRHDISNMIKERSQVEKQGLHQEKYDKGNSLCKMASTVATSEEKESPAFYHTGRVYRSSGYESSKTNADGNTSAHT